MLAAAGFTVVHTYDLQARSYPDAETYCVVARAYLDTALRHNLQVLAGIPRAWLIDEREDAVRAAIRTLRNHPALLAWYEEEIAQEGALEAVQFLDKIVQEEDPLHGLVIEEALRDHRLLKIGVARMFTYYPATAKARERRRLQPLPQRFPVWQLDRPFWPSLQAFGQDLIAGFETPNLLLPTRRELQYSLYSAVVSGAQGFFFYPYLHPTRFDQNLQRAGRWPYTDYRNLPEAAPDVWRSVCATATEALVLLDLISKGTPSKTLAAGLFPEPIEVREWTTTEGLLLVLANPLYDPVSLRIPAPEAMLNFGMLHNERFSVSNRPADGVLRLELPGPGGIALLLR